MGRSHARRIKAEKIWFSHKARPVSMTVMTQLSSDRIPTLFAQCASWQGALSAVVFLALVQEDDNGGQLTADNEARVKHAEEMLSVLHAT